MKELHLGQNSEILTTLTAQKQESGWFSLRKNLIKFTALAAQEYTKQFFCGAQTKNTQKNRN